MARTETRKEVTVTDYTYHTDITCDKCGRTIDPDEPPDGDEDRYAQVLEIYLNLDLCVNDRVKLDLCRTCLEPIWAQICAAIGADPSEPLRIGQDD
jgi:hypothetical protein